MIVSHGVLKGSCNGVVGYYCVMTFLVKERERTEGLEVVLRCILLFYNTIIEKTLRKQSGLARLISNLKINFYLVS